MESLFLLLQMILQLPVNDASGIVNKASSVDRGCNGGGSGSGCGDTIALRVVVMIVN